MTISLLFSAGNWSNEIQEVDDKEFDEELSGLQEDEEEMDEETLKKSIKIDPESLPAAFWALPPNKQALFLVILFRIEFLD